MWYGNQEVLYGIASTSSNDNATYVENLQLEGVLEIINENNNFKFNNGKISVIWQ